MSGTGIGDDGMAAFTRLPQLEELDLTGTTITRSRPRPIEEVPGLRRLILNNAPMWKARGLRERSRSGSSICQARRFRRRPRNDRALGARAAARPASGETDVTSAGLAALASRQAAASRPGGHRYRRRRPQAAEQAHSLPLPAPSRDACSATLVSPHRPLSALEYLDLGRTRISSVGLPALRSSSPAHAGDRVRRSR